MKAMAETVREFSQLPAMKYKVDEEWQAISWQDFEVRVRVTARAFLRLGLEPGEAVAIIGNNRPEWLVANLAAIYAGGVPAGVYQTASPEQCRYIADHSGAAIAVVEDRAQLEKFNQVRAELPSLTAIVMMDGSDEEPDVHAWEELRGLGESVPESELDSRIAAQLPDDLCTLIYTSGTTGNPKGVMMTHDNLIWTAKTLAETLDVTHEDCLLSYLPLSHIAEQVASIYGPMVTGFCCWFSESMDKLGDNLREVRPTIFMAVPRVWEKIQAKMVAAGARNPWHLKKIAAWARKLGLRGGYAEQDGRSKPLLYGLADKLVFKKVRDKLGLDRCRLAVTSTAPISRDTLEFFLSLGIPVCEAFGMSECTGPTTFSKPERYRTGKAGWALPGAELAIAEDGEILIRGRHVFAGYFKDEAATAEALDAEGRLHSGDIGALDEEGYLAITDRKKDIIITSGGENISPQMLEGLLAAIPALAQVAIIGNGRKFLSALFTLDPEKLATEAEAAGSPATNAEAAACCARFREYIQRQVDAVNNTLARVQTIKKFIVLPNDFTIDGGELTPTMKKKRRVIDEKYARQIESMYTSQGAGEG